MYIDFTGTKQEIVDIETGEIQPVEVFVAILPCSQLTYVEAVRSQKKEDLIKATENTLLYFERVPLEEESTAQQTILLHENIRGKEYYK